MNCSVCGKENDDLEEKKVKYTSESGKKRSYTTSVCEDC